MAKLQVRYRLEGKALPPRPIRIAVPGWGGSADMKMETGSYPQPWHCPLFVNGSTHGVELLYPFDTLCQIVNENGNIRILWDPAGTPGDGVDPRAFTPSVPRPSQNYLFNTMTDLQAPPGYVLRTEPHPRYFADLTGTSPAAMYGHVQTEWWPKQLFVVFKIPLPGQRHIFRKGEPYAQVVFVPEDTYDVIPMPAEAAAMRRKLEREIGLTKSLIGKIAWHSANGMEFNDHYRVLARAYEREGLPAVESIVNDAMDRFRKLVPTGKTISQYLEMAERYRAEGRRTEAKEVLHHILRLAPQDAEAHARMALLEWDIGIRECAIGVMSQAVQLQPQSPQYRLALADMLRETGKFEAARAAYQATLLLRPNDPQALIGLGFSLAQLGLPGEALAHCDRAVELAPNLPSARFIRGLVLLRQDRRDDACASFEAAILLDPTFAPAREALTRLAGGESQRPDADVSVA